LEGTDWKVRSTFGVDARNERLAGGGGAEEGAPCGFGLAVSGGGWGDDGFDGLGADVEVEA